jgi:hypothetical protein
VPVIPATTSFPAAGAANAVQAGIERYAMSARRCGRSCWSDCPTVWHQSPAHAIMVLEELRKTAKLKTGAPACDSLTADQLALLQTFDQVGRPPPLQQPASL